MSSFVNFCARIEWTPRTNGYWFGQFLLTQYPTVKRIDDRSGESGAEVAAEVAVQFAFDVEAAQVREDRHDAVERELALQAALCNRLFFTQQMSQITKVTE